MSDTRARFAVGDRVVALPDTTWDDDLDGLNEAELAYWKLHGHYGHVVDHCDDRMTCCWTPHVRWEGTWDGRQAGPTDWTSGHIWHVSGDEIEHAD